jgi:hypothetical protein
MGIELYWDDDAETVMLMEVSGSWTWDDLFAVLHTTKTISQQRQRVFGAIVDVRGGLHLPGGSVFNREGLAQFTRLTQLSGGKKGPIAFVGMNGMMKSIFEAATRIDKQAARDTFFAATLDEARQFVYPATRRQNEQSA